MKRLSAAFGLTCSAGADLGAWFMAAVVEGWRRDPQPCLDPLQSCQRVSGENMSSSELLQGVILLLFVCTGALAGGRVCPGHHPPSYRHSCHSWRSLGHPGFCKPPFQKAVPKTSVSLI